MNESLDTLTRSHTSEAAPRRWPAWLVPCAIALGFALLFLGIFRDRILPAQDVRVAMVLATTKDTAHPSASSAHSSSIDGPMAFQASGWIEPDPLPIRATALIDGVIKQVHILEGQTVSKGQELADLIDDEQQLALRSAEQMLAMRKAELVENRAAIRSAHSALASAIAQAKAAEAALLEASDRSRRLENLRKGTVSEADVVWAQSRRQSAQAELDAAHARAGQAESDADRLESRADVLESAVRAAEIDVSIAQLALDRTKVRSPIDGRVLRLLAAPGQKKQLGMDDADSSTIAILYNPAHLQARVDISLADAAGLHMGQLARVRCSLLPDTIFSGIVTRITGEADMQRNTLQAKVRIENPSDLLRPEMLTRVEFLHARTNSKSNISTPSLATWIPVDALSANTVWTCDPETHRVQRRIIHPSDDTMDGFRRIAEGLKPGEWVVRSPTGLADGQRVNPKLTEP